MPAFGPEAVVRQHAVARRREEVGGRCGRAARRRQRRQVQRVRGARLGDAVGLDLRTQPVGLHTQVVLERHPDGLVRRDLQDRRRCGRIQRPCWRACWRRAAWACPEADSAGPEANMHTAITPAPHTRTQADIWAFTRITLSPKCSDQKDRRPKLQEPGTARETARFPECILLVRAATPARASRWRLVSKD